MEIAQREKRMTSNTIMLFAPHPDDEILGVGGTIAKKVNCGWKVIDCIVTSGKDFKERSKEAIAANKELGISETVFLDFPDLGLDRVSHTAFTDAIRGMLEKYKPVEVYLPHPGDLHTDHKALTAAAMVAIRPKYDFAPKYAYAYETLSETELDFQSPQNSFGANVYVDITDTLEAKIKALHKHESQLEQFPGSRCEEAIKALATYRGAQAGMHAAEAFSLIRGYER